MVDALRDAGFFDAEAEADDLIAVARDSTHLSTLVARRLTGEPAEWIVGSTEFLGLSLTITPGVYVPRWHTEAMARHAASHLDDGAVALDLCTGSGAIAAYLRSARPTARVLATDIDATAVACARANGVEAYAGDLFEPLPSLLRGEVGLVVAVPPYVPEAMLAYLPRDVVAHEPRRALVGGTDGLDVVARVIDGAAVWLRTGGALVIEVGIDQVAVVAGLAAAAGFVLHETIEDRGICALADNCLRGRG